jgi:hypothetical protein
MSFFALYKVFVISFSITDLLRFIRLSSTLLASNPAFDLTTQCYLVSLNYSDSSASKTSSILSGISTERICSCQSILHEIMKSPGAMLLNCSRRSRVNYFPFCSTEFYRSVNDTNYPNLIFFRKCRDISIILNNSTKLLFYLRNSFSVSFSL